MGMTINMTKQVMITTSSFSNNFCLFKLFNSLTYIIVEIDQILYYQMQQQMEAEMLQQELIEDRLLKEAQDLEFILSQERDREIMEAK